MRNYTRQHGCGGELLPLDGGNARRGSAEMNAHHQTMAAAGRFGSVAQVDQYDTSRLAMAKISST